MMTASVMRAVTGALSKLALRRGRQVQADQRHDRAGDDRRHDPVDPAGAELLHHGADDGEGRAGEHHPAERPGDPELLLGGQNRRDEREAGAEVAGHPALGDDQEQQRADAGKEQGGGRRHAREDRDQEGGAEHGHDVLHADADRQRPGEPLVGPDNLAGADGLSVAVEFPLGAEHAHCRGLSEKWGGKESSGATLPRGASPAARVAAGQPRLPAAGTARRLWPTSPPSREAAVPAGSCNQGQQQTWRETACRHSERDAHDNRP